MFDGFKKIPNITFHENPSSRSRVVPRGRTEGRHDGMTKLIVAFSNCFANALDNSSNSSVGFDDYVIGKFTL